MCTGTQVYKASNLLFYKVKSNARNKLATFLTTKPERKNYGTQFKQEFIEKLEMLYNSGNKTPRCKFKFTTWPPCSLLCLMLTHHRKATLIGVLRQEVKRSAGSSGFIGKSWFASHDANWIQFLTASGTGMGVPWAKQR